MFFYFAHIWQISIISTRHLYGESSFGFQIGTARWGSIHSHLFVCGTKADAQTAKQGQSDATMTYNDGIASEGAGETVMTRCVTGAKIPALVHSPTYRTCTLNMLLFLFLFVPQT